MDVKAYSSTPCIHQLIEQQVQRTPDAPAVVFGNDKISYKQLDEQANGLALSLLNAGIRADSLVGICVPRSVELIIGILAIWKAGAGYVPIDPNYPAARVSYLIEDSKVRVVLTRKGQLNEQLYQNVEALKIITVDDAKTIARDVASIQDEVIDYSRHLAYVIYTSGSTGKPKGVQIEHKSVINLYEALSGALELEKFPPQYQATLNASVSFDASVQQFLHLSRGATLHIISDELRSDPKALVDYLVNNRILCLDVTPSLISLLLPYMPEEPVGGIPLHILIGGEAISPSLWRALVQCRSIRAFNVYGPTEATVDTTIAEINNLNEQPHIGKAIANAQCLVLDEQMRPLPAGETGELYIGGVGLARGYLHRPELTKERFIPDPFSTAPEARLYRTGDNAILLPNGNIQYVGRIDNQVKVRGYRIELGEIETALLDIPDIGQAAVIIAGTDDKYLSAFITQANAPPDSVESFIARVKSDLRASLPAHLVPSRFHALEKLPLNPSGKVDRHVLAQMDREYQHSSASESPRTEMEGAIAEIWQELLHLKAVGIRDNFFDLGGHSLLLIRLISQLRERLGLDLSIADVFENPTIEALAGKPAETESFLATHPLKRAPRGHEDLLSFEEMTFFQFGGENSPLHMTAELLGPLNITAITESILITLEHHTILRSRFERSADGYKRIIQDNLRNAVRFENVEALFLGLTHEQFLNEIRHEIPRLDTGDQVFYATIYQLEEERFCLAIAIGHIVAELISFDILLSDIARSYNAIVSGQHIQLRPQSIQYSDYAYWQREYASSNEVRDTLKFWANELANLPPYLNFPAATARDKATFSQIRGYVFSLDKQISDEILAFSRSEGATVFMTLLAALTSLVASQCQRNDIVVVSPVTNRYLPALENLVGGFINLSFFRNKIESSQTFRELVRQVKSNAIKVYNHQKTPLLPVVERLAEQYGQFPSQVFQLMLDMITKPAPFELKGMRPACPVVDQIHSYSPSPNASMDLIWLFEETPGGFQCKLNYNSAIFSKQDAGRLIEDFRAAISLLLNNPDQRISQLA